MIHEIIKLYYKETKQFQQIFMKKGACKTKNIYILLAFLLITNVLLITVSSYWYLIKYKSKQKDGRKTIA